MRMILVKSAIPTLSYSIQVIKAIQKQRNGAWSVFNEAVRCNDVTRAVQEDEQDPIFPLTHKIAEERLLVCEGCVIPFHDHHVSGGFSAVQLRFGLRNLSSMLRRNGDVSTMKLLVRISPESLRRCGQLVVAKHPIEHVYRREAQTPCGVVQFMQPMELMKFDAK